MHLANLILQHLGNSPFLNAQQSQWLHGQMQNFAQTATPNDFAQLHNHLQNRLPPHLLPHITDVFSRYAPARAGGWQATPYAPMPQAPGGFGVGPRMGGMGMGAGFGMGGLMNSGTQVFSDGFDTTMVSRDMFGNTEMVTRDMFNDTTTVQTDAMGDEIITRTDMFGDTTTTVIDRFGDSRTTTNDGFGW